MSHTFLFLCLYIIHYRFNKGVVPFDSHLSREKKMDETDGIKTYHVEDSNIIRHKSK